MSSLNLAFRLGFILFMQMPPNAFKNISKVISEKIVHIYISVKKKIVEIKLLCF